MIEKNKKSIITLGVLLLFFVLSPNFASAQLAFPNVIGITSWIDFLATVVRGILGFLGAVAAIVLVWCGVQYMLAQDSGGTKNAIQCITNATAGLIVIMVAYLLVSWILGAMGLGDGFL
jgi:hypothetical protein